MLVDSRFFWTLLVILVSFLLRSFTMSHHSSSFPPNLLKTLETDIYKFKLYGPPVFRLNIQCKHKEHCKYGKYSCQYSHESFCKFQRNGKKCQNSSCTHLHGLPAEYQLAQEVLMLRKQLSCNPDSFETQIPAHRWSRGIPKIDTVASIILCPNFVRKFLFYFRCAGSRI